MMGNDHFFSYGLEKLNSMTTVLPLSALRAFVEVGQRGSIKAAAEALHVTSGAVSQQIRLLEDRVGVAPVSYTHLTLPTSDLV